MDAFTYKGGGAVNACFLFQTSSGF